MKCCRAGKTDISGRLIRTAFKQKRYTQAVYTKIGQITPTAFSKCLDIPGDTVWWFVCFVAELVLVLPSAAGDDNISKDKNVLMR